MVPLVVPLVVPIVVPVVVPFALPAGHHNVRRRGLWGRLTEAAAAAAVARMTIMIMTTKRARVFFGIIFCQIIGWAGAGSGWAHSSTSSSRISVITLLVEAS